MPLQLRVIQGSLDAQGGPASPSSGQAVLRVLGVLPVPPGHIFIFFYQCKPTTLKQNVLQMSCCITVIELQGVCCAAFAKTPPAVLKECNMHNTTRRGLHPSVSNLRESDGQNAGKRKMQYLIPAGFPHKT